MKFLHIISAVVFATALSAQSLAQHNMSVMDLMNIEDIRSPRLSPDGTHVLFTRGSSDWKQNKRVAHIWLAVRDGSNMLQLTNSHDGESTPRWSPNSGYIAFIDKRGDDKMRQIYVISISGGEAQRLTEHETDVTNIAWAPDGSSLFFIAAEPDTKKEKKRLKLKDDIFPFNEHYKQKHLWRFNTATGKSERVTEGDFTVRQYDVAPDGKTIAYSRAPTPLLNDAYQAEIWLMQADGTGQAQLTKNNVTENGIRLSPDGQQILFAANADSLDDVRFEEGGAYYNSNVFVMSAKGSMPRLLQRDMPYGVDGAEWAADGDNIYISANMGVRDQVFRLNVASDVLTQLTSGDHSFGGWHYQSVQDAHALSIATADNPGDVYTLTSSGSLDRATHVFDNLAQTFALPKVETVHWKGEDGGIVEGLLYYPVGYEKGRRYPLVVQTHGGPTSSDQFGNFSRTYFMQALTSQGYAVFKTNHRGSTGYGDAFMRDMVGGYFRQAHLDVMAGVDHLIEQGIADPDRLIKMGWSAGGHMTNKLITHTNRFKAAASGAGALNWVSMIAQSDIRQWRTAWFGGTPWQDNAPLDKYLEHSPLKDIGKATTPTLILVGGEDVRVPPAQSVALYHALKDNGVDTKLYIAPREPHGWRELRHQLFRINVQLEWFAKYALNSEYEWEYAPDEKDDADS